MHVENGWVSPYMVRDTERMETVFENPHILMTNAGISHPQDLLPALDLVMKDPRPLVVLAEKVDGGALGMLVANNQHRTIEASPCAPRASATGAIQHLGDLAAFTGGQVIAEEAGLIAGERAARAPRDRAARDRHRRLDDVHRGRRLDRGGARAAVADPRRAGAGRRRSATSRSCRSASPGWR